MIWIHQKEWKF